MVGSESGGPITLGLEKERIEREVKREIERGRRAVSSWVGSGRVLLSGTG